MTKTKEQWDKVREMNVPNTFSLGQINGEAFIRDPKHLLFTLSRYKFAAKMMKNCKHIIDIGSGEGIGTFMFLSETQAKYTGIDFDQDQVNYSNEHILPKTDGRALFLCKDLASEKYDGAKCDGLVSLDVIEHIAPEEENTFLENCVDCIKDDGVAIIGTPNLLADKYASERSRIGHINLFEPDRLETTLKRYFKFVSLFSMNDEMIHTGFSKMSHYLMTLCVK